MPHSKLQGWLNIARKAGKLAIGAAAVKDAIRGHRAELVFSSSDAGGVAKHAGRALTITSRELGAMVGRDTVAVMAVCARGIAEQLIELGDLIWQQATSTG